MTLREMPPVTLSGVGTDTVEVAGNFRYTQLTVQGLEAGTFTVEKRAVGGARFTLVEDGQIDLTIEDTILIKDGYIDAVRLTVSEQSQYDLIVVQQSEI